MVCRGVDGRRSRCPGGVRHVGGTVAVALPVGEPDRTKPVRSALRDALRLAGELCVRTGRGHREPWSRGRSAAVRAAGDHGVPRPRTSCRRQEVACCAEFRTGPRRGVRMEGEHRRYGSCLGALRGHPGRYRQNHGNREGVGRGGRTACRFHPRPERGAVHDAGVTPGNQGPPCARPAGCRPPDSSYRKHAPARHPPKICRFSHVSTTTLSMAGRGGSLVRVEAPDARVNSEVVGAGASGCAPIGVAGPASRVLSGGWHTAVC